MMRLLAALCVLAAARAEETSQKSRLLVVNGLEGDAEIDVYFAGSRGGGLWSVDGIKPGTMVCVASSVKAGFEFEVHVGEVDDEFVVTLSNNARQGETYGQIEGLIQWRHSHEGDATIYLTGEEDAHAVWRDDLDEVSQLAWKDGVGALFEDADRFLVRNDRKNAMRAFATARRSLGLAVATDGAAPLVWPLAVLAGVAPANNTHVPSIEDAQPLEQDGMKYVDTIRNRALHHGCWLARLTLGSWRAHGKRGMEEDCNRACDVWTLLLRDVAPFGGGSPRRALVKTRHVNLRQAELLVDHWLRADGMATLRDDAMQQFDDEQVEDEDVVAPEIIDAPAPAAPGGFFRRLLHGPDDLYDEVVFDGAPMEDGGRVIDDAGAAYLERRAIAGDGHAALQLGDAWLDGRVARRRPSAAAAAPSSARSKIETARSPAPDGEEAGRSSALASKAAALFE